MKDLNKIQKFLAEISVELAKKKSQLSLEAVLRLEAQYKRRIFLTGRTTNGRRIGKYSEKPIYVSVEGAKKRYGSQIRSSSLKPSGKNKRPKFQNGKRKKSQYFEDGYKGFREQVGRQTKHVDLNLTGDLQSSIKTGKRQRSVRMGFLNPSAADLVDNLEAKYGDVFTVSKAESEAVTSFLKKNLEKQILKKLKAL